MPILQNVLSPHTGERHEIRLRVCGPDAAELARQLVEGLDEAEFAIPGHIVADVTITDGPAAGADGAIQLTVEALTVAEN